MDNIKKTYTYIRDLIKKINKENIFEIIEPTDDIFISGFMNAIQKFKFPKNSIINHNDLSNFSRFFYPYVSVVIEPKKRQSLKSSEVGKYGTYLRYKRVSNYDNKYLLEQKILYFLKNYEYNEKKIIDEICKQFNITEEIALNELILVQNKYPHIKKSRKILKKMDSIHKYKQQGIGVDIQGRHADNYKIRVSGAKNDDQLNKILSFIDILLFLYIETYIFKLEYRQELINKLNKLKNIAKRRKLVNDFVTYETKEIEVKKIIKSDKTRYGL